MTERIDDAALDARLEAHFEDATRAHEAPDFDALIARAEAQVRRAPRRRCGRGGTTIAAVAAVAMLGVFVALRPDPVVLEAADERLVIELTRSTAWTAPSDRWLTPDRLEILAMPNFDDMTHSNALNQSTGGGT